MPRFRKGFQKTVWGFIDVIAKDEKEAEEKLDNCDFYDEFDNKSDYEFDEEWSKESEEDK